MPGVAIEAIDRVAEDATLGMLLGAGTGLVLSVKLLSLSPLPLYAELVLGSGLTFGCAYAGIGAGLVLAPTLFRDPMMRVRIRNAIDNVGHSMDEIAGISSDIVDGVAESISRMFR